MTDHNAWRPSVLIAEDDPTIGELLVLALARAGFLPRLATDGRQALADLTRAPPDLLLSHGTVGEDMELVIKLHRWFRDRRRPYRITFIPEPMCWTEAPESLAVLARQRQRWSRGSLETYVRHWTMTANSRYGTVGWIGMTRVLLTDVVGPVVEFLGYSLLPLLCIMGLLSWSYFAAFLAVSIGFGIAVSIGGLALAEAQLRRLEKTSDLVLLALVAVLENFGYRQLCMIWRVQGLWQFVTGDKSWGVMTRKGFAANGGRS